MSSSTEFTSLTPQPSEGPVWKVVSSLPCTYCQAIGATCLRSRNPAIKACVECTGQALHCSWDPRGDEVGQKTYKQIGVDRKLTVAEKRANRDGLGAIAEVCLGLDQEAQTVLQLRQAAELRKSKYEREADALKQRIVEQMLRVLQAQERAKKPVLANMPSEATSSGLTQRGGEDADAEHERDVEMMLE
ncbi:hypothetical protein HYDPIDRAFT_34850 [Hydnomerulius pinastri MD-312]|uniref:Zn(2)-C6 fungal-type domain-containing protein n=1 Tax=Hydnomerulius pinastri MD-312 TaxID=994086 RepID=A0A0C9VWV5_9AGAM|nr:hypothetical protein HYDPIDRAFT_34850 [Hydnomerulius pinastri MD-312]